MEKFVYYGEIFNIYKGLLSKNNQEIFSYYFEDNLTLQEIAKNLGVSKSYVGNVIKMSEKKLDDLESNLHIYENNQKLNAALEKDSIDEIKKIIINVLEK